jgi:hypothetical protein
MFKIKTILKAILITIKEQGYLYFINIVSYIASIIHLYISDLPDAPHHVRAFCIVAWFVIMCISCIMTANILLLIINKIKQIQIELLMEIIE